jgi:hypothetical protein
MAHYTASHLSRAAVVGATVELLVKELHEIVLEI